MVLVVKKMSDPHAKCKADLERHDSELRAILSHRLKRDIQELDTWIEGVVAGDEKPEVLTVAWNRLKRKLTEELFRS